MQATEAGGLYDIHHREHLLLGVLVLVAAAGHANADAVGHVANAGGPNLLVKSRGDDDLLGAHSLGGELADLADSAGGLLLEGDAVGALAQVDRGNDLEGLLLLVRGGHFAKCVERAGVKVSLPKYIQNQLLVRLQIARTSPSKPQSIKRAVELNKLVAFSLQRRPVIDTIQPKPG